MLLKRELGPKSWPIGADVDAVCSVEGAVSMRGVVTPEFVANFPQNLASMNATFAPRSGHDHAVIGPRSWVNPRSLASKVAFRSSGRWFRPPGITITPRSRSDRAAIVEFFHEPSAPSDRVSDERTIGINRILYTPIIDHVRWFDASPPPAVWSRSSLDEDQPSDRDQLKAFCWCRSGASQDATWREVSRSIIFTYSSNSARGGFGDRVDRGSRDLSRRDQIRRPPCVHVACKRKPCGNIVPHGENQGEIRA